jgi:O-antigen/teichoic acid export membrane protein
MSATDRVLAPEASARWRFLNSRIVLQTVLYTGGTGAATALSGIAKIILARRMDPSAFGSFSFCLSFLSFAALLFDFGLFVAAARRLARSAEEERSELVGASLALFVPLAIAFGVAIFALSFVVDDVFHAHASTALRVTAPLAFAWAFPAFGEQLGKGTGRLHVFSISSLIGRAALVAALAALAVAGARFSTTMAVAVNSASMALSTVILAVWLRPTFRRVREHVRTFLADTRAWAFQVYVGRFLSIGTYNMDVLMVTAFSTSRETGFYSLAAALTGFLGLPLNGLAAALFPRWAARDEIETRWLAIAWAIGAANVVFVVILAPLAIRLAFGASYGPAAALAIPLALAQAVRGVTTIHVSFMSAQGHGRQMRNAALILTGANLVLNFALIPPFGATGAAWASFVALVVNYGGYRHYYSQHRRGLLKDRAAPPV